MLQGQLSDFSASEILQLLGTQRKTGCLALEHGAERRVVYVVDGRIVSTRTPGLAKDDPLLGFLRGIHRLSEEQARGIATLHRETGRDLEDLLLNGRYVDEEELAACVERQILEDVMQISRWEQGAYRFDPALVWTQRPLARLTSEGVVMEAARRADEQRRYDERLGGANLLLGVRDLPDPADPLTEEERELFGIIDGGHTIEEVVQAAPLTDFETREALHRFLEAGWIEITGTRAAGAPPPPAVAPVRTASRPRWARDLTLAAGAVGLVAALRLLAPLAIPGPSSDTNNVFAEAQVRDVR